jgi:MFS family permease
VTFTFAGYATTTFMVPNLQRYFGLSLTGAALSVGVIVGVTGLFALGWFFQYAYFTTAYPAIHDVVPPQLRATAIAVFFALFYVLGEAFGPLIVGLVSDHVARTAMTAAGQTEMTEAFRSVGLHASLFVVPAMLLVTAVLVALSALRFPNDRRSA